MDDHQHEQFLRHFTASEHALRGHIRRLVPSPSDSDDLMQDVAVVLWRKFGEFSPQGNFLAWACGVAKYEVLAWRRKQARSRILLSGEAIELLADESIREESQLSRQREQLKTCLDRLTTDKRELLLAAYTPGVRIHDVAARSGRTVGGFYQWLHRMKRLLLDCLRSEIAQQGET